MSGTYQKSSNGQHTYRPFPIDRDSKQLGLGGIVLHVLYTCRPSGANEE